MGITYLHIYKVSAQIIYDIILELLILLNQDHTNRPLRCDHIYQKVMDIVRWTKNVVRCQGSLQNIERLLGFLILDKRSVFLQQTHESFSKIGKIDHKSSQEVRHSLQTLKMLNITRWRQLRYCLNLQRIDPYTLLGNNEP